MRPARCATRFACSIVQAGLAADAFEISFQYPDRFQAQQATRDLVARFTGAPQSATEILDPASDPNAPAYPNRLTIVVLATVAGILLGSRHRIPHPKLALHRVDACPHGRGSEESVRQERGTSRLCVRER